MKIWNASLAFYIRDSRAILRMERVFFQTQEWLPDPSGLSVAELYVLFIHATGWYVPQNVSSFPPQDLPPHLRAKAGVKVWSHESEMPSLQLSRDIFAKQLRIFPHAVQMLLGLIQSIHRQPWLRVPLA